jgi:hypothetical protein
MKCYTSSPKIGIFITLLRESPVDLLPPRHTGLDYTGRKPMASAEELD